MMGDVRNGHRTCDVAAQGMIGLLESLGMMP